MPIHTRGVTMVLFAGVIWSMQGLTIRLIQVASSEEIVFWRAAGQVLVMFSLIAIINRGRVIHAFRRAGVAGLIGGVCSLVASTAFIFALGHTTVANVVFFLAASPFFAAILAWVVMRERIPSRTVGAMLVALVGIGVMTSGGVLSGNLIGQALSFVTMLGFAGIAVVARWGGGIHMLPQAAWGALFTFVVGYGLCGGAVYVPAYDIGMSFVSGGVLTTAGVSLFLMGARYVPAAVLAFLTLTEVVLGPLWVWLAFDEMPSRFTLIGGVIVLGAIVGEAVLRVTRAEPAEVRGPADGSPAPRLSPGRPGVFVPVANIVVGSLLLATALILILARHP